ncbi:hypothetical protein, partial [Stenotrophomonas pavanii]|uniref:hypothetical protein n=1 Tax=Stenotrophomonas pavanii TaxID=487698 RepID=UPI0039C5E5D1
LLPINTSVIAINYGNRMSTKGWPVQSVKKRHLKVLSRLMSQSKAEERTTGGDLTHGLSWLRGSALQYPQGSGDRPVIAKSRDCLHRSALATV